MDSEKAAPDRASRMPVFQLVYISSPVRDQTADELMRLLEQSRRDNIDMEITGLLLYRPGMFMQVLEGEQPVVRKLYARIERDVRHRDVTVVWSGQVALRRFADWTMAFRDLRDPALAGKPGFSEFLNMPMVAIPFLLHPSRLEELLLAFRANLSEAA